MPRPAKDGFPEPAVDFDNPAEVREWVDALTEGGAVSFTDVLIASIEIGPLRAADPILADLVVNFRASYRTVFNRLDELNFFDSLADGEPVEPPTTVQSATAGAVPEDQA
jgi:hypothetical protein